MSEKTPSDRRKRAPAEVFLWCHHQESGYDTADPVRNRPLTVSVIVVNLLPVLCTNYHFPWYVVISLLLPGTLLFPGVVMFFKKTVDYYRCYPTSQTAY